MFIRLKLFKGNILYKPNYILIQFNNYSVSTYCKPQENKCMR